MGEGCSPLKVDFAPLPSPLSCALSITVSLRRLKHFDCKEKQAFLVSGGPSLGFSGGHRWETVCVPELGGLLFGGRPYPASAQGPLLALLRHHSCWCSGDPMGCWVGIEPWLTIILPCPNLSSGYLGSGPCPSSVGLLLRAQQLPTKDSCWPGQAP